MSQPLDLDQPPAGPQTVAFPPGYGPVPPAPDPDLYNRPAQALPAQAFTGGPEYGPPSASDPLAAQGQPIRLMSGHIVPLRFSMASLRVIEQRFGSLRGVETAMKSASDQLKEGAESTTSDGIMTVLSDAIAAGLLHVKVRHPDTGATIRLGQHADVVMHELDPGQLQEYTDAFAKALSQAFGTTGKASGETPPTPVGPSPGPTGITPQPSSPGAQIDSSGA